MEVDVLRLCASDQKHNDGDILATIEDELRLDDDEAMSELANSESSMFDESRADDGDACDTATSRNRRMLTPPDDSRSGGVAPATDDIQPSFDDESGGWGPSSVCALPLAGLSLTVRSDTVESPAEEAFSERQNNRDGAVDACSSDSAGGVDCALGNAPPSECDLPALPDDDASKTACSVPEPANHPVETVSDTPNSGNLATAGVVCDETTSSAPVIDSYAVADSSNVITLDVDSCLIVSVPVPDAESAGHVTSCSADAVLTDDVQQNSGLSDETVTIELVEAINVEAKKKGFRVRFHEDHVTGYHDPPTPWREGWFGSALCHSQCIFLYP